MVEGEHAGPVLHDRPGGRLPPLGKRQKISFGRPGLAQAAVAIGQSLYERAAKRRVSRAR
jgi:hypothetical protein